MVAGKLDVRGVELAPLDEAEAPGDLDVGDDAEAKEIGEGEADAGACE